MIISDRVDPTTKWVVSIYKHRYHLFFYWLFKLISAKNKQVASTNWWVQSIINWCTATAAISCLDGALSDGSEKCLPMRFDPLCVYVCGCGSVSGWVYKWNWHKTFFKTPHSFVCNREDCRNVNLSFQMGLHTNELSCFKFSWID